LPRCEKFKVVECESFTTAPQVLHPLCEVNIT